MPDDLPCQGSSGCWVAATARRVSGGAELKNIAREIAKACFLACVVDCWMTYIDAGLVPIAKYVPADTVSGINLRCDLFSER
jgi:hypothetical protein